MSLRAAETDVPAGALHLGGYSELCGLICQALKEKSSEGKFSEDEQYIMKTEHSIDANRMSKFAPPHRFASKTDDYERACADVYSSGSTAATNESTDEPKAYVVHNNPGSAGHPESCARKCIYFATGSCSNGVDCGYCHMPHRKRPCRLDRNNRNLLQGMSFTQRAVLILPLIKEKMETLGLSVEAVTVFEGLLASEAGPDAHVEIPQTKIRNALRNRGLRILLNILMEADMTPSLKSAMGPLSDQLSKYCHQRHAKVPLAFDDSTEGASIIEFWQMPEHWKPEEVVTCSL